MAVKTGTNTYILIGLRVTKTIGAHRNTQITLRNMAKKQKRQSGRYASVYYIDQIEAIDKLAERLTVERGKPVSRASLLKEGADMVLDKYKTNE